MQHRVFSIDKDYGLDYLKFDESNCFVVFKFLFSIRHNLFTKK